MTSTVDADLDSLYADFAAANLLPRWTQHSDLMTEYPGPPGVPALALGDALPAGGTLH